MFKAVTQLIETHLSASWNQTPIAFDGVEFSPTRGTPFVRLQVEWVDTAQVSIGNMVRGEGYAMFSVFTPSNQGSQPALNFADQLAAIFTKWTDGGLTLFLARTVRVGMHDEWYQVNVLIPFKYDKCN